MAIQCGNGNVEAEHSISAWQGVPQLCMLESSFLCYLFGQPCFRKGGSFGGAKQCRCQIGNIQCLNFPPIRCMLLIPNVIVVRLSVDYTIARCGPFEHERKMRIPQLITAFFLF